MNLYYQFLTQNQTVETARILEAITILTDGESLKGRIKVFAQGAISRSSFSDIGALAGRLAKKRFNELALTLDVSQFRLAGGKAQIQSVESTFSVSPTCALWFPVREWKTDGDRASDNRYRTAQSHEAALAYHHITKEPSVLGIFVDVTTELTKDALLDECGNRLANLLPEICDRLRVFGCCDVAEPIFIPELKKSVVMPQIYQVMLKVKPPGYPELGKRFEALHSLMFGPRLLCEGIGDALGKDAKLITGSRDQDFAVVRFVANYDADTTRTRVADWLIAGAANPT